MNVGQIVGDSKHEQLAIDQSYRELERYLEIKHKEAATKHAVNFARKDSNRLWYFLESYVCGKAIDPFQPELLIAINALEQSYKNHQNVVGLDASAGDIFIGQAIALITVAVKPLASRYVESR